MFNAAQFLNTEINGGIATEYVPVPDGDWGPAQCVEIKIRTNKSKDTGEEFHNLDTSWELMDDELKRVMELDRYPRARSSIILDFDDEGNLKRGKGENVKLGILLDAAGMNDPNKSFLLGNLKGQTVDFVRTKGRTAEDGQTYVDIVGFAKA